MARRRKQVTYDSRETRTVLGLLSLVISITFFLSVIVPVTEANFFTEIRTWFGQTTWMPGFFFLSFGLYMFESDLPFAGRTSVIAQGVLVGLIPAFIISLHPAKADAFLAASQGFSGGQVGYFLAYQLFADSLVFAQYTPLILGLSMIIFIPLALSMSVSRLVEGAEVVLSWLWKALRVILSRGTQEISEKTAELEVAAKASMFGDFNKLKPEHQEDDRTTPQVNRPESEIKVKVSEREMGELGLAQDVLAYPNWQLPQTNLLAPYRKSEAKDPHKERNAQIIEQTLASFGIEAKVVDAFIGPTVIQYALNLPLGIAVKKVESTSDNLALALGVEANSVRIESIPGTTYLGIEVPRSKREMINLRELMESDAMQNTKAMLPVPVGKDIHGGYVMADIQKMPHLLIAGATGSGKSITTNSFITSLLMNRTPDELKLILVDPKKVELSDYNGIPHLLTPVITEMDKVVNALKWAVMEMDRRYTTLAAAQVREIGSYNQKMGFAAMPYIVIVIDEMADMMMTAGRVDAETAIVRLAQKARAVGIHLVLATQRPSVNVITGIIKANIPERIGMSVASVTDSRVILDAGGAESLQGKGDLLHKPSGSKAVRLQGPFVSQEEVIRVVDFIKSQVTEVTYTNEILEDQTQQAPAVSASGGFSDDDLFAEAVRIVVGSQKTSSSYLQRQLRIGFNRAARLIEQMEAAGVISPAQGNKPGEVLIGDAEAFLAQIKE